MGELIFLRNRRTGGRPSIGRPRGVRKCLQRVGRFYSAKDPKKYVDLARAIQGRKWPTRSGVHSSTFIRTSPIIPRKKKILWWRRRSHHQRNRLGREELRCKKRESSLRSENIAVNTPKIDDEEKKRNLPSGRKGWKKKEGGEGEIKRNKISRTHSHANPTPQMKYEGLSRLPQRSKGQRTSAWRGIPNRER